MIPSGYTRWREKASQVFTSKRDQYGESWSELSLPSFVDLLYVKAQRIRTLVQSGGKTATGESTLADWLALANYAALALLRLRGVQSPVEEALSSLYQEAESLLTRKNADYGDAWSHMRPLAFVEFILMKLARLRKMDTDPARHAIAIEDNLFDIMNYALLYLVRYGDESLAP
ncbi:MAG: DUF1599 domain-containing protein [Bacteroidia bacterium]|nr:DUF1599 domain-containing protein [Bacteroidia bacterium]